MSLSEERLTNILLGCGVVAGPAFILVGLILALTRTGFDMRDHPLSLLSVGEHGWMQITSFVVAGLLFIGFAVGLRRVIHDGRGGTWGPRLVGIFGACLIAAGLFVADPAVGFPPGTPDGPPESMSWHGILHAIAFTVGFPSLIIACFVFARWFADQQQRGWTVYSVVTGVTTLVFTAIFQVTEIFMLLWITTPIALAWPAAFAMRLYLEQREKGSLEEPAVGQTA